MAIFGSKRDITTFTGISRELVEDVASQDIGYYKIVLKDTPVNIYGEATSKYYIGPVLLNCLIERGDREYDKQDFGIQTKRIVTFRFMKYHLIKANVVPEAGDVVMYNESYYQVDGVNENQLILGKDSDYAYEQGLENFGNSFSVIVSTHLTSPDALGITQQKL